MKTEHHNIAGRMIIKALSNSPWGAGLVNTDIGSDDKLAQHNLQIPAHASNRIIPPYLFPRNFPTRSRLTSRRPVAIPLSSQIHFFFSFFLLLTSCVTLQTQPHTEDHDSQPRETTPPTESKPAACALD
eukprot:1152282-Pelagomonas_calceolata.AAC.2